MSDTIISTHRDTAPHCQARGVGHDERVFDLPGLCGRRLNARRRYRQRHSGANGIVAGGPPFQSVRSQRPRSQNGKVVVIFQITVNQGTRFEAMNMAVVLQAPAVFVIEQLLPDTPQSTMRWAVTTLSQPIFGFPVLWQTVPIFAVHEAAGKAIALHAPERTCWRVCRAGSLSRPLCWRPSSLPSGGRTGGPPRKPLPAQEFQGANGRDRRTERSRTRCD